MDTNKNLTGTTPNARMGNGTAVHLTEVRPSGDGHAIICNRWGSSNGRWTAPKLTTDEATCKRCLTIQREATR